MKTDYELLNAQLKALTDHVPHLIANLANASALLYETLPDINWAGFYILEADTLILGPFQGKTACIEIHAGKGVCGKAVETNSVQCIRNVHEFPGHIACDTASNSEIVIPLHLGDKIWGVLDIDSSILSRFDADDVQGLKNYAKIIEEMINIINKNDGGKVMNSIFHRVSIRKFKDQPVEPEKITEILRAGMQAPSAGNQQPWEFYVVTDKEKIEALSKAHLYAGCAAGAPVVIVPVYRTQNLYFPQYAQIDLAIAQENMWLMTDALGLGGTWLGIAPLEDRMAIVNEILDLPGDLQAYSLFPLGYPAETKEQQNRFDESRIHYVDKSKGVSTKYDKL